MGKSLVRLIVAAWAITLALARVPCNSTAVCEAKLRIGSECNDEGFCTNPFHQGGCLAHHFPLSKRLRTCNSDDPPEAIEKGYCQPSALDYTEVRVFSQNWESGIFAAWILQILLSELMDVPVSLETGAAGSKAGFYDIDMPLGYGTGNDWDSLRTSHKLKDCRKKEVPDVFSAETGYEACSHVVPEVWTGHAHQLQLLHEEQAIEFPSGLGALGAQGWFVPRHTARSDLTLLSYLGLQGKDRRKKLAETFKRPTSWEDYCLEESADNCTTPDTVASRAPQTDAEKTRYFSKGSFTGYFRLTDESNCTKWPDNCTGHIVDYPCGWSSFVKQQAFHLDIGVASSGKEPGSGGYSYSQMVEIYDSANATGENVLLHWWTPEALYQTYLGTDMEFQSVNLPPPTQDCVENRVPPSMRCDSDPAVTVGDAQGACGEQPEALLKVIGSSLYDISFDPTIPEALHSPAYSLIKNFRISDLQYGEMFKFWFARNIDKYGYDPRDAICQWFVENVDVMESFVPRSHPRVIEENLGVYQAPIFFVSVVLACMAVALTFVATVITYVQRERREIRLAQVEFLFLLLAGTLLVSVGSLLTAIPPTNLICVSVIWFINFGYTLELVPLVVKIAAVHHLMVAARQMRREKLKKSSLFGAVLLISCLVGATLLVWTLLDPPREDSEFQLTGRETDNGETVIQKMSFCGTKKEFWNYVGVTWQALLLLCASVLAFQTRKIGKGMNETRTLAMLIYSHFVFAMFRAITYVIDGSLQKSDLAAARSILYSCDVIATLFIYFLPKFLSLDHRGSISAISRRISRRWGVPNTDWQVSNTQIAAHTAVSNYVHENTANHPQESSSSNFSTEDAVDSSKSLHRKDSPEGERGEDHVHFAGTNAIVSTYGDAREQSLSPEAPACELLEI